MDSIHTCSQLMRQWDTYYSVPIAQEHQKYLKFMARQPIRAFHVTSQTMQIW